MRCHSPSWMVFSIVVATAVLGWTVQQPGAQAPAGAAIPRTADGRPNLAGVWQVLNSAAWDIEDHHADSYPGSQTASRCRAVEA